MNKRATKKKLASVRLSRPSDTLQGKDDHQNISISSDQSEVRVLQVLKDSLDLNKHLHQMSNLKSGMVLVAAGLIANGILTVCKEYNKLQNPWVQIGLIIIFVALVISTIAIAISVYPRDGKHDPENVIYFVDYTTGFSNSQEYKDRIILKTKTGSLTDCLEGVI
jgi:hypothetical protein